MKKNSPVLTIIAGFIAGLVISGILGDIIVIISNAAGRASLARSVSKAERHIAGGNFEKAKKEYEKALGKIKPDNKKLLAKIKNNTALIIFTEGDGEKNAEKIKEKSLLSLRIRSARLSLVLFSESSLVSYESSLARQLVFCLRASRFKVSITALVSVSRCLSRILSVITVVHS